MGVVVAEDSLTGESVGRAHSVLENTQARPPENQHQGSTLKDAIHLWEVGEVTESGGGGGG